MVKNPLITPTKPRHVETCLSPSVVPAAERRVLLRPRPWRDASPENDRTAIRGVGRVENARQGWAGELNGLFEHPSTQFHLFTSLMYSYGFSSVT